MKKTESNKPVKNNVPTYAKVIAGILAGLMIFSVVAVAITALMS